MGKVPKGQNWIEVIKNFPDNERIVAMLDSNLESHAFSISLNEFEAGSYIVSFTDISHTMMEHKKLQLKLTHDKLTNALNREFFDKNINLIIEEARPHKLGIIICDIDHFKNINDTFGHLSGDYALQEFTKIIGGANQTIYWTILNHLLIYLIHLN